MLHRFEHRTQPLLSRRQFAWRMLRTFAAAGLIIALSLAMGVLGYHYLNGLHWLDALVDASMILGGMGPVNAITTTAGKWFASFYALFSGVIFLTVWAIVIAPVAHRVIHRMHLEEEPRQRENPDK